MVRKRSRPPIRSPFSLALPAETLAEILNMAPAAIYAKDRAGRPTFFNARAAALLGIEPAAVLGRLDVEVMDVDAGRAIEAHDRAVMESDTAQEWEEVVPLADGPHTFLSLKFPLHDAGGTVCGLAGISTDITSRVRLTEDLRVANERLRSVVSEAPVSLSVYDADGVMTYSGGKFAEDAGSEPGAVLGRSYSEILKHIPDMLEPTRRALAGEPQHHEVEIGGRHFERHLVPRRDDAGRPSGVIAVTFDVTDRRREERLAAASRARLEELVDHSPVVIGELESFGTAEETISYVSPNFERVLGYAAGDVVGVAGWRMAHLHPEDRVARSHALPEVLRAVDIDEVEVRFRHANGEYRWLAVGGRLFAGKPGTPIRAVWHAIDVTDRVVADEERRAAEARVRAAERLESLGQLAGGVAHDFKNLLSVILTNVAFVRTELSRAAPGDAGDRIQAALQTVAEIELAAIRAGVLSRQLLAFGRSDQDDPEILRLGDLLANMQGFLRHLRGEGVALSVHVAPGLWPVLADRGRIEQVLVNLVANARDAMAHGGSLVITLDNVDSGVPAGRHVRMAVTDTGSGMLPGVAARAFEPFFTTKVGGTGLGLATVDGAVRQAGGEVEISSEVGRGTTVTILLPAAGMAGGTTAPPRRASGEVVLVIVHDQGVRDAVSTILAGDGYEVVTACDAAGAMAVCTDPRRRLDLVVTDVAVPGTDGPELAREMLAVRPGLAAVIVAEGSTAAAPRDGAALPGPLLPTPFSSRRLLRVVGEALDAAAKRVDE